MCWVSCWLADKIINYTKKLTGIGVAAATGADNVGLCINAGHANVSRVDSASVIRQAGSKFQALHPAS